MSSRIIIALLIGVLVALAVVGFLATHDRVSAEQWVGPSGEARLRQFLAAERFAERMGLKATEVRTLPELDTLPVSGVVLLPNRRQEVHAGKLAELLRWVERGGHLIVEAELLGVPDPLFERLGITRSRAEALRQPLTAELPGSERKLRVFFGDAMQIETQAKPRIRIGSRLVSFARGRGTVTAASSLRFARNPGYDEIDARERKRPGRSIGAHDHAELFWVLLSATPARELHVYFRPERLSLWGFLKENAAPALVTSGLLLALWLWSIVPRFGPVAPDAPPGRRRLLDHLRASGRYYWVRGLRSRLVVAARDAALRRIARAQPDFALAPQSERIARLASLADISKEDAARFISAAGAVRGADFIRIAHHAQRIHSALEKGAK
jgi:hypothetical protein